MNDPVICMACTRGVDSTLFSLTLQPVSNSWMQLTNSPYERVWVIQLHKPCLTWIIQHPRIAFLVDTFSHSQISVPLFYEYKEKCVSYLCTYFSSLETWEFITRTVIMNYIYIYLNIYIYELLLWTIHR